MIVGSLRRESFTRKVAMAMKGIAPASLVYVNVLTMVC